MKSMVYEWRSENSMEGFSRWNFWREAWQKFCDGAGAKYLRHPWCDGNLIMGRSRLWAFMKAYKPYAGWGGSVTCVRFGKTLILFSSRERVSKGKKIRHYKVQSIRQYKLYFVQSTKYGLYTYGNDDCERRLMRTPNANSACIEPEQRIQISNELERTGVIRIVL